MKKKRRSTIKFTQAPKRSQEIALAKQDYIDLFNDFRAAHPKLKKEEAYNLFSNSFSKGLIGNDIRERLREKHQKLGYRAFRDWEKSYRNEGIDGLVENFNNGGVKIDPVIREGIEKLIWQDHLGRYQDIVDDLRVLFPKAKLNYTTVRNYAKEYREKNWPALVLHHEGQKGLRDRGMQVALGRMDEDLTEPNQRWEIDTTIADLFTGRKKSDLYLITADGKRCKVIGVEDVFSRALKFYMVERETGLAVGQVMRDQILDWGLPEELVIDNGKPFKNKRVLQFLRSLGISAHICIPGNPVEKPHIERAFRTLTEKLFRRLPGYSGNSVQTRPNEIEISYTKNEVQKIIDDYISAVYMENIHRSTGQRPRERMSPPGFVPKKVNERDLDILLMEEHERKVRQGCIEYQGGKYFHSHLPEGRKVRIRPNDFDASEILVFVDRKFLCIAEDYRRKGKTPTETIEARKERNRELRTRIKANEPFISKKSDEPNMSKLIRHYKKKKPGETPKKAEIIEFPEFIDIHYSKPIEGEPNTETFEEAIFEDVNRPKNRSNKDFYLDIMRRKIAGESLDERDEEFMERFTESNEYRLLKPELERILQTEVQAANEG